MSTFILGLSLGFAYIAPIGLQNLFVINNALCLPKVKAYISALIVIFFDITLALACFFGIGLLMDKFDWLQNVILLIGSIIVMYIGFTLLKSKDSVEKTMKVDTKYTKIIITACVVTWFNPQAIIDGTMMIGAFKATLDSSQEIYFILGMISASILWFLGITTIVSIFSDKFNEKVINVINKICGIIIIVYGIKLLLSFIFSL